MNVAQCVIMLISRNRPGLWLAVALSSPQTSSTSASQVIFDSSYFHQSGDTTRFSKKGYTKRRINFTMLYGERNKLEKVYGSNRGALESSVLQKRSKRKRRKRTGYTPRKENAYKS